MGRLRTLAALGAEVTLTDPMEGTDRAIREAARFAADSAGRVYYADQYSNPANWRAHYLGTAEEIVIQYDTFKEKGMRAVSPLAVRLCTVTESKFVTTSSAFTVSTTRANGPNKPVAGPASVRRGAVLPFEVRL